MSLPQSRWKRKEAIFIFRTKGIISLHFNTNSFKGNVWRNLALRAACRLQNTDLRPLITTILVLKWKFYYKFCVRLGYFFYPLSLKMLFEASFTASYQERPVFAECDFPGSFDGVVDGEDVVAVDPDGWDTVSRTAHGNPVTAVLFARRRWDGVPVVPAEISGKE